MSLTELLLSLKELDRPDKLRVVQFLVNELAREESVLLDASMEYPIWSPHGAFAAADALLDALKAEDRRA
ncbi:MAG: hypothetical protein ACRD9R_14020 [Pyrinomonadaceae bacterium]